MTNLDYSQLNIAVVMGGKSAEREVSLRSGNAVLNALSSQGIKSKGFDGVDELMSADIKNYDAVFNILHGESGENGNLAGLLSSLNMRYTGSDATGAVLSWHKDIAKTLVREQGVLTPQSQTISKTEQFNATIIGDGPWIIKPTQEGSSVGLYFVKNKDELAQCITNALYDVDSVLVEQFIKGTECTVSIIKNQALPVIRIKPAEGLYDYKAKYENKSIETVTQYFCPSGLDPELEKNIQESALLVFKTLKLSGWARIDYIVDKNNNCWFLEANTTPGMTETSLVPKSANAVGWSFEKLVATILSTAFEDKVHD